MAQALSHQEPIDAKAVSNFIEKFIVPSLREKLMIGLRSLTLNSILKNKNPYLIKVGGTNTANEFIEREIENSLCVFEDEIFASSLERIAIFICGKPDGGRKTRTNSVYLALKEGRPCRELRPECNRLYRDMLGTLRNVSQERVGKLQMLRARKINMLTGNFLRRFSSDGLIQSDKLIQYCFGLKRTERTLH